MSLSAKEAFNKLPQKLHNFFLKHPPRPFVQYKDTPSTIDDPHMNPFLPNKNPETGRWHGSKYSLRRSADLFKMAYKFGIHDMLPPVPRKFYEDKYVNKNWMKGVMNFKKHKWERTIEDKLQERQEAIAKMDETIANTRRSYRKQLQKQHRKKRTWW